MALRPRAPQSPVARAWEGAFEAGLSVAVGLLLGYYADRWLGTEPVLLIVFVVAGGVAGVRRLLRIEVPTATGSSASGEPSNRSDHPERTKPPEP